MKNPRVTYHTRPDELGRRCFTLTWEEPDGVFRTKLGTDGKPVGYRRGQVFNARPEPFLAAWRAQSGGDVVEVEELER